MPAGVQGGEDGREAARADDPTLGATNHGLVSDIIGDEGGEVNLRRSGRRSFQNQMGVG